MRAWFLAASLAFAAGAQAQPAPERKSSSPIPQASGESPAIGRLPSPNRNQFKSPVMAIEIEGAGLTVPAGAERDSPYSPPPVVPATPTPPATAK
jgi:hypothetical protein